MWDAVLIALFLPLCGFIALMTLSYRIPRGVTEIIACSTVGISFLCFLYILIFYEGHALHPQTLHLFNWISVERVQADVALLIDPLSLVMGLIITGVGFLIHLYSLGYIEHEKDYARYFACMNLFIFAMLLLVLAENVLLLFVGWEGVGLASYLLIGYWYERPVAAQAATKAFVVNRVGDLGFLLALLLTFYLFGTGSVQAVADKAKAAFSVGAPVLTVLTLLYFVGAVGKSAQIPLHVWLSDAMAGPTPVSALIHAATMVTAGVYLVVRLHELFLLTPFTLHLIGAIGGATALFAALCAVGQTDLKRVLAYSTVSQLGLMFLACGVGAFYAAIFHLTTHAFMKALLFLSAGNVVHMMHGTTEMAEMGGLRRIFTKTHWLFLIGVLAMSGVPPLAAFFSKDLILEQEHLAGFELLFYTGLVASILTAFYLTRAYCLTFTGPLKATNEHLHEAPKIMVIPVVFLALLAIGGGFLGFSPTTTPLLERFLAEIEVTLAEPVSAMTLLFSPETFMSLIGGLLGIGTAAWIYTHFVGRFGSPWPLLYKAFFIDELYDALIVRPLKKVAEWIAATAEPRYFEGSIQVVAHAAGGGARLLQGLQSGQVRSYAAYMLFGAFFLITYFLMERG